MRFDRNSVGMPTQMADSVLEQAKWSDMWQYYGYDMTSFVGQGLDPMLGGLWSRSWREWNRWNRWNRWPWPVTLEKAGPCEAIKKGIEHATEHEYDAPEKCRNWLLVAFTSYLFLTK